MISRRPGTQDISWFLDQHAVDKLDLDPPYQRRSVWTSKDRRYFLDTLFRGFPCPPIYLHKTLDQRGAATYHVVDGKQRIETVIMFAQNRLRIPEEYGDERLNNKRWKDIVGDTEIRNKFLNYPFVVEYFDGVESSIVNEIFERMNKNSRKLTQQELRNARFDGWFSREVDREVNEGIWRKIGIATTGKARRMADAQFIAELLMVTIQHKIVGFEHGLIDSIYATYDDLDELEETDGAFDEDAFRLDLATARDFLTKMYESQPSLATYLSSVSNMYVLWAVLILDKHMLHDAADVAASYVTFMEEVGEIAKAKKMLDSEIAFSEQVPVYLQEEKVADNEAVASTILNRAAQDYFDANQSATTEFPQRSRRLNALRRVFNVEN